MWKSVFLLTGAVYLNSGALYYVINILFNPLDTSNNLITKWIVFGRKYQEPFQTYLTNLQF